MTTSSPERLHALDAVRGFALLLGIVFHATISFLPGPQIWVVMDNDRSSVLALLFFLLHVFRMTTFFLIAGFFAHLLFHRRGPKGFAIDRAKRIALPLVVGWPVIFGAVVAVSIWGAYNVAGGDWSKMPPPPPPSKEPGAFPLLHLWFLWVLLLLYLAVGLLRAVVAAVDHDGRIRAAGDKIVAWLARSAAAPLLLAVPATAALTAQPDWMMWGGIPTPDRSLIPNAAAAVAYGAAFLFGWVLHRQPRLIEGWAAAWPRNLALALAATAASLAVIGLTPGAPEPFGWRKLAAAFAYAVAGWSWTLALVGLALRFLADESPLRRYLADASYWLYLIHIPIVMALQVAVAQLALPWWVKFPLILTLAMALMLASYQLMVRHTFVGAILNGRRFPRPARKTAPPVPASSEEPAR